MKLNFFKSMLAAGMLLTMAIAGNAQTTDQEPQPTYPGGDMALMTDLNEHLKYPESATSTVKEVKVFLSFVVNTDGSVSDIKVLRSAPGAAEFEKAAVEAIGKIKKFQPAYKGGVPVAANMVLPVVFRMD